MTETPLNPLPGGHKAAVVCVMILVCGLAWYFSPLRNTTRFLPVVPGFKPGSQTFGPAPGAEQAPYAAVDIQGDYRFKSLVTHSLRLIWLADLDDFQFIKQYLRVIRNENKTDFYLEAGAPVIALSNAQAGRSLTWCAGLIAHQAFHAHAKLNSVKKPAAKPPLPGEKDSRAFRIDPVEVNYTTLKDIFRLEAEACDFQERILKKVGAPPRELAALSKRRPRDFSVSHDGNYSITP